MEDSNALKMMTSLNQLVVINPFHIHNKLVNANNRKILSFARAHNQSKILFWKILYVQLLIMDAQIN